MSEVDDLAQFTLKLDDGDKKEATAIVEELGLDLPTVTRAFYKQIIRERRIPLDLSFNYRGLPEETRLALDEADQMIQTDQGMSYASADELFSSILGATEQADANAAPV